MRHLQLSLPVLLVCAALFATTSVLLLLTILVSRVVKTKRKNRHDRLRDDFQKTINALIILEHSQGTLNHFSLLFHLKELRAKIGTLSRKQLLIDLLVANKQNLRGDSAAILKKVYVRLGLKRYSSSKLNRVNIIKKISGLQEIAEMECYDLLPAVQELFEHSNSLVRQESFIAVVRLASPSPFVLVDDYVGSITPWMQLTIHKHLTALPPDQLPKFWKWFYSANREIKKFSLNMAHQFRQLDSVPHLARLLDDIDLELAGMAAQALGDMGAAEHTDAIVRLGSRFVMNESISLKVIYALGEIGNGDQHSSYLAWQMIHGSYAARIEAMRVMKKLNLECGNFLVDFGGTNDDTFQNIHEHITHPLLRK